MVIFRRFCTFTREYLDGLKSDGDFGVGDPGVSIFQHQINGNPGSANPHFPEFLVVVLPYIGLIYG